MKSIVALAWRFIAPSAVLYELFGGLIAENVETSAALPPSSARCEITSHPNIFLAGLGGLLRIQSMDTLWTSLRMMGVLVPEGDKPRQT